VSSKISDQLGIEPEVAFSLKRPLPPLPSGQRYGREELMSAIGAAHAAIEIVISRFERHETAEVLDRLADNISNGGLVLGPPCEDWRRLDFATVPLRLSIVSKDGQSIYESRGGHPLADPLLPMVWLANHCADQGSGLQAGDIVTTGSYAGLRHVGYGGHVSAAFEGLGVADLYS
jgi:2-keto-4-pentenoate hydratase